MQTFHDSFQNEKANWGRLALYGSSEGPVPDKVNFIMGFYKWEIINCSHAESFSMDR